MKDILLEQIRKTEKLQRSLFYSNEKNPFDCTYELYELLKNAITKKEPFSMVRLGDGEGRVLAYPNLFNKDIFLNQVLTYQFGSSVVEELKRVFGDDYLQPSMTRLQSLVLDAIKNADIVGAPSWLHFRDSTNDTNIIPQAAQSVCLTTIEASVEKSVPIFDHFIFKPFHKEGLFNRLLKDLDQLTVISHTDITDQIASHFNLPKCDHIRIPGHQSFMQSGEFHYPTLYPEIESKINVKRRGDVFLVAAGYLGKHYCNIIKKKGGIGIDIGSIFDGWAGKGRPDATANKAHLLKGSRTLYIHMGHHKTGTTSLQWSLKQSEHQLADAGVNFLTSNGSGNSSELISVTAHRSHIVAKPQRSFYELIANSKKGNAVISAEHLSFIEDEKEIEELFNFSKQYFDEVRVICYLRRQDKLAISLKQQAAKQPFYGASPSSAICGHDSDSVMPKFTFTLLNYLDFKSKIEKWQAIFGNQNVILRIYDKKVLVDGCVCKDFSSILGLKKPLKSLNINEGLGVVKTKVKHFLLETKAPQEIVSYVDELSINDSNYTLVNKELRLPNILSKFYEDNTKLDLDKDLLACLNSPSAHRYMEPARAIAEITLEILNDAKQNKSIVIDKYKKVVEAYL